MDKVKIGNYDDKFSYIYPKIYKDEFSNNKLLTIHYEINNTEYFFHSGSEKAVYLYFAFRNIGGEDYIVFKVDKSEYKLKQGDKISFLFEQNSIIDFAIENKPIKSSSSDLESTCHITISELGMFCEKLFLKWKIISVNNKSEIIGGLYSRLSNPSDVNNEQKKIIDYTIAYKGFLKSYVDNYKPLDNKITEQENSTIYNRIHRDRILQDIMDAVWRRDEGKCVQCGSSENLEFDHIIPVSKGGANTYRNIQLLCEKCNRKKSNRIG